MQQEKTAYDGFYLFTLVPVGHYILRVSPDQLERLNLSQPLEREVLIGEHGTIVSGLDFTIELLPKGREPPEAKEPPAAVLASYASQASSWRTTSNAREEAEGALIVRRPVVRVLCAV